MPSKSLAQRATGARFAPSEGFDLNTVDPAQFPALARRAALRRRALQDYQIPPTEGSHESADRASLIFTGAPEGEVVSGAEKVLGGGAKSISGALLKSLKQTGKI